MITPEARDEVLARIVQPETQPAFARPGTVSTEQRALLEILGVPDDGLNRRKAAQWLAGLLERRNLGRASAEQVVTLAAMGWDDRRLRQMDFNLAASLIRRFAPSAPRGHGLR